jgi:hypothetical protein
MRTINVDNLPEPLVRAMETVVATFRQQFEKGAAESDQGNSIEPTSRQYMKLIETSGSLAFCDDPAEDIYSLQDGEPV